MRTALRRHCLPGLRMGILTFVLCGVAGAALKAECFKAAGTVIDLSDRFVVDGASGKTGSAAIAAYSTHYPVARRGKRLDCMILVAPLSIRAPLGEIRGRMTLECLATPVFNVGDGFLMEVLVVSAGMERLAFSRYFDPGRSSEDRDWITLSIPLDFDSSRNAHLQIRVSAGPQGDLVDDWLALSGVRLKPEGTSK